MKKTTLCQGTFIFYDLMRACYPINTIKEYIYDLNTFMGADNKKNIIAFKNVIISYMSYFFTNYKNINFDEIPIGSATIFQLPKIIDSIKNELCKSGVYVSYFKEENIGGRSANFIGKPNTSNIFEGIDRRSSICFNILIRLISLMDKFFFAYYELQALAKDYIFGKYMPSDRGTTLVNALFRFYFYLFNDNCQIILYNITFFLIKWLTNIKDNKDIALLPLYLIDFPFQIVQLMLISKSKILFNNEYRKKINENCEHFKNDDYLETLCAFYIKLFEDKNLTIYSSLIQSLGWKIYLFLREKKSRKIILKNHLYITKIISGISNIVNYNNTERIILRIITILGSTTFENLKDYTKDELSEEENYKQNTINILNKYEYKTIFSNIIHYLCKNLNAKLTLYNDDLSTCKHYCIDLNFIGNDVPRYNNNLKSSLKAVISVINFYEFILNISLESFFNSIILDIPLIYIKNFFVTLTSRILDQPYFSQLEKVLNHIYINDTKFYLLDLFYSTVNLFLLCKDKENKLFVDFIVTTKNILLKPLLEVYNYGIKIINEKIELKNESLPFYQKMKTKFEEYKLIIDNLEEKRKIYDEEYIKNLKDIEFLDDEYLCVMCLGKIADYCINPCLHKGCKDCLLTYLADNNICFMCRQPFDSVTKIPKEEIDKIITDAKAAKTTKTGDEQENNNE